MDRQGKKGLRERRREIITEEERKEWKKGLEWKNKLGRKVRKKSWKKNKSKRDKRYTNKTRDI